MIIKLSTMLLLAALTAHGQDAYTIKRHRGHYDVTTLKDGRTVNLSEFPTLKAARSYLRRVGAIGNAITEDDPRWDCRTMGDKKCGPNAPKPVYYCNAMTKKNTPCKHRVKKQGDRCWQHRDK